MSVFDKWTKKATDSAVDNVKETLNDKLETYSGIIKIGLTLGVIIFGSRKINDHFVKQGGGGQQYPQPIVINNYISDGRYNNGRQGQTRQGYQNRR